MAIIREQQLFSWRDCDELGDLERLKLVLDNIKDEQLMRELEKMRKGKRDDYPIRPLWNSLLARIVFQHKSMASLIRELQRNAQFRELCGFDALKGVDATPSIYAYSRFMSKIFENPKIESLISEIFEKLVDEVKELLPDFGKEIAFDGKAVKSHANGKKKTMLARMKEESMMLTGE